MEIIYKALDGKEFDDEYECKCYENLMGFEECIKLKELLFFNASGKQMTGELYELIESSTFVYVSSSNALNILLSIAEVHDYDVPQRKGLWEYIEAVGWVDVKNRIREFMKQEVIYNFIKEIIGEGN